MPITPLRPLLEPLGLLHGPDAREAVRAGAALPLLGGVGAFTLVRSLDPAGPVLPVGAAPAAWGGALARLAAPAPVWAGLPHPLPPGPAVMGILNATPDSFSDGGDHLDPARAVAAGRAMLADGAVMLDIGGESTRPGAAPTPPEVERARILPVLRGLAEACASPGALGTASPSPGAASGVPLCVDTRNAATMAAALDAGACVVNDVSALAHDPDAVAFVARRGCPVVLMHMRGTPETMRDHAVYTDVALDVTRELEARVAAAEAAGIARERIAVDPGFGFAKTADQNAELLRRLPVLLNLGLPILVGLSRKGFIGALSGEAVARRRSPGSVAAGLIAASRGASVLRVHDVCAMSQALKVWQAMMG